MTPSTSISLAPRAGGCHSSSDSGLEPIAPRGLLVPNGGTLGCRAAHGSQAESRGRCSERLLKMLQRVPGSRAPTGGTAKLQPQGGPMRPKLPRGQGPVRARWRPELGGESERRCILSCRLPGRLGRLTRGGDGAPLPPRSAALLPVLTNGAEHPETCRLIAFINCNWILCTWKEKCNQF